MNPLFNTFSVKGLMKKSKSYNGKYEVYYRNKVLRLATGQFKYICEDMSNLWLIEYYLFINGMVMIWYSDILGWVITPCVETRYDINGLAIRWRPVFQHQSDVDIPRPEMGLDDKCVVIYDLENRQSLSAYTTFLIPDIVDICETMKSQTMLQKTPILAVCDNPKDISYVKKAVVDYLNNMKVIFTGKDLRTDIKSMKIDAPFNVADLQALLKCKESEILEYLGIDYLSGFQKKERLITDEQESNNQVLTYLFNDRYESRRKGVEELNKKGLNIRIEKVKTEDLNDADDEGGENDDKSVT